MSEDGWTRSGIAGVVASVIGDTILEIAFGVSLVVGRAFDQLNNAFATAGGAAGDPFVSVGIMILNAVARIDQLSGFAGPAAPLVAVVVVAAVVVGIGLGIRGILTGLKWLT